MLTADSSETITGLKQQVEQLDQKVRGYVQTDARFYSSNRVDAAANDTFLIRRARPKLDVDDDAFPVFANPATSATEALTFGLGLNWHMNRNIKLSFDYSHTKFKAAPGNPFDTNDEDVFLTRVQFSF